jgi:hypothetical protein
VNATAASISLTLENCTIAGNSAPGATAIGGGVRQAGGTVTIQNCIVAGNTAGGGSENLGGGTMTLAGANIITGDPLIAPLGNYGGPTQTRPPLAGSPAIDAAVGSTFTTDQRGFAIAGVPDIGAVDGGVRVTTTADEFDAAALSGTGISLREAVRDCPAGGSIVFAPVLSGGTITLDPAKGQFLPAQNLTIDASALPRGLTLHGGNATRVISVPGGVSVSMTGFTFTGGTAAGPREAPLLSSAV